jgi:hypothetical protein
MIEILVAAVNHKDFDFATVIAIKVLVVPIDRRGSDSEAAIRIKVPLVITVDHMDSDSKVTIRIEVLVVTTVIHRDFDSNSVASRKDSDLMVSRKDSGPVVSRKDSNFLAIVIITEMDSTITVVVALEKDVTSVAIMANLMVMMATIVEIS